MPKAKKPSLVGPSFEVTSRYQLDVPGDRKRGPQVPKAFQVEREDAEPVVVPLYPDRHYIFGRTAEAHFVFTSDSVSRLHGQLRFDGTEWIYRDLSSRNGSFLAASEELEAKADAALKKLVRVKEESPVRSGQTLLLANSRNRIVFLEELPEPLTQEEPSGRRSSATVELERSIELSAHHGMPVFLLGPSGSGKTYVAKAIHERKREKGQFIIVNCGALPTDVTTLTSTLLGHEKGAFTGAGAKRLGLLWAADQGTLFLDEVEFLPRVAQDFLVDVLEPSGSFAPLGAAGSFAGAPPSFRLISASKRPLGQSGLRPDLCERLGAGEFITLPTLEDRRQDIPGLIERFLQSLQSAQQVRAELTPEAVRFLQHARWPGQIRQLEATVKTVVNREYAQRLVSGVRAEKLVIGLEPVRKYLSQRQQGFGVAPTVVLETSNVRKRPADLTREELVSALSAHDGNKKQTAAALGMALNTLKDRMKKLGV